MSARPARAAEPEAARLYSIGDLCSEFALSHRAIRFYEDRGLLAPRRIGANRVYGARDRARLQLILRGKRLGFALADIKELREIGTYIEERIRQKEAARAAGRKGTT